MSTIAIQTQYRAFFEMESRRGGFPHDEQSGQCAEVGLMAHEHDRFPQIIQSPRDHAWLVIGFEGGNAAQLCIKP